MRMSLIGMAALLRNLPRSQLSQMFVSDNDNYLIGMTLTEMLPNGDILGQKQEVKMVFNQVLSR